MGFADDARNKAEDLKGRTKEAAGAATGDDQLKAEGKADQGAAHVKEKFADAADKIKDGVDAAKNKLSGN